MLVGQIKTANILRQFLERIGKQGLLGVTNAKRFFSDIIANIRHRKEEQKGILGRF